LVLWKTQSTFNLKNSRTYYVFFLAYVYARFSLIPSFVLLRPNVSKESIKIFSCIECPLDLDIKPIPDEDILKD